MMQNKNILFTGYPGCGKSTLIERIFERFMKPACGFFTREIREGGKRTGFSINTLDGKHGILAKKGMKIREVPVGMPARKTGESHLSFWKYLMYPFRGMWSIFKVILFK